MKLGQYFRTSRVAFFLHHKLISEQLAGNMLAWLASGAAIRDAPARDRHGELPGRASRECRHVLRIALAVSLLLAGLAAYDRTDPAG